IELLRAAVSEIKLFSEFSLNDHTGSYITVLIERESDIATVIEETEKELNTDKSVSRRDDTSLQDMTAITTAVRDVREEEDMTMKAVLS
ncbi:hypothetical protein BDFG_09226, partial [Blastomyces dermatitidis ATCC 26199]